MIENQITDIGAKEESVAPPANIEEKKVETILPEIKEEKKEEEEPIKKKRVVRKLKDANPQKEEILIKNKSNKGNGINIV